MFKKALIFVLCFSLFSPLLLADEAVNGEVKDDYQYYLIKPDIITNYIKPGKRVGYVRVSVELMVKSKANYALLENHEPLIRDKIITIFGEQSEAKVKSVIDRDTIRQRCLDEINELLFAEAGKRPVKDLMFTKYLYQ